jgi:hypothetical protein
VSANAESSCRNSSALSNDTFLCVTPTKSAKSFFGAVLM